MRKFKKKFKDKD